MRKNWIFIITVVFFSHSVFAQCQYEVLPDRDGSKLLKGIISKEVLLKDSSYSKWFTDNLKGFIPNAGAVTALKKKYRQYSTACVHRYLVRGFSFHHS